MESGIGCRSLGPERMVGRLLAHLQTDGLWGVVDVLFSAALKDQVFTRSHGRCECTRTHHGKGVPHLSGRCPVTFGRLGAWEAHHKVPVSEGGSNDLPNCEVLCMACHHLVGSVEYEEVY